MEITREGISRYIEEYGVIEALRGLSELVDNRVYFKISTKGIERKELKMAFPAVAYLKDKEKICKAIYESVDPVERQHIGKINRLSNLSVEKLKEKFIKLLLKESKEHALSYAKELLLRDKTEFYSTLGEFILMDSLKNRKALILTSFKKLGRDEDEFITLLISYIVKARADYSTYERVQSQLEKEVVDKDYDYKNLLTNLKERFKATFSDCSKNRAEALDIAAYLTLLSEIVNESSKDRCKIFFEIVEEELKKIDMKSKGSERAFTEIESDILSVIF